MWDPDDFAESRGGLKDLLRKIPGFSGYLDREARRTSDQLLRQWMADRLQQGKGGLDQYGRGLADAARIDQLPQLDSLRGRIDTLIARLRGARGLQRFF